MLLGLVAEVILDEASVRLGLDDLAEEVVLHGVVDQDTDVEGCGA